eukprot:scaffold4060_cov190-Amphora_coffeaeformis.AAC.7
MLNCSRKTSGESISAKWRCTNRRCTWIPFFCKDDFCKSDIDKSSFTFFDVWISIRGTTISLSFKNSITNQRMKGFRKASSSQWLLILLSFMAVTTSVSGQSLDNFGSEFIAGFLPNVQQSNPFLELQLTGSVSATINVEYPVGELIETAVIVPGNITIVNIPLTAGDSWPIGSVRSNLVRASSVNGEEFAMYLVNRRRATSDAALALPVDTFNTEYIAFDFQPQPFSVTYILVYAAFDGTNVTIEPRGGGSPVSFTLNRGEGFVRESSASQTGSIISSSRPVGVANGNQCTFVGGVGACDHLFEVAHPVQTWGTDIGVAALPQRPSGSIYRIGASKDNTTVTIDGTFLATLDRGEFFETSITPGNHVFRADSPIFVVQYMTGSASPGATFGDPAMGNMIPFAQYQNEYVFSTLPEAQFRTNYVSIIASDQDVQNGAIFLDESVVPASNFTSIPDTDFSAAVIQISGGVHSTSSTDPHGITVEGYDSADSYIFPGGALFNFINPVGDSNPPILAFSVVDTVAYFQARDDRPTEDTNGNNLLDEGEDINGNGEIDEDTGIFFVALAEDANNLVLDVDSTFIPGDGMVQFTVSLDEGSSFGNGTVSVSDGSGNQVQQFLELSITEAPSASPTFVGSFLPTIVSPVRKGKGKGYSKGKSGKTGRSSTKKPSSSSVKGGKGGKDSSNRERHESDSSKGKGENKGNSSKCADEDYSKSSYSKSSSSKGTGDVKKRLLRLRTQKMLCSD